MPNLVMEYSNSVEERVNIPSLLEDLHQVVLQSHLFEQAAVKSRAIRVNDWLIGDVGNTTDFIHVSVELLDGRSDEQKALLSQQLIEVLQEQAQCIHSLTINIRDMNQACFQKRVN